ncbi:Sir2 family NAD-dependent protein deacetylase [Neobacillus ginsengisoli]|nr:Sir2 family NAD-dependent protein deacetylase [Neobacillus ginsengisoli]
MTQNTDGFHSGNLKVSELHGTLSHCHCNTCGKIYDNQLFLENQTHCNCGGFIRPSVILFGESLSEEAIAMAEEETIKADLFIVLGSSLQVSPANYFPTLAKRNGAKVVIVNGEKTPLDPIADLVINDKKIGNVLEEVNNLFIIKSIVETILEVGWKGGSISLVRHIINNSVRYCVTTNEGALYDEADDLPIEAYFQKSGLVSEIFQAMKVLDRYPWAQLVPIKVHDDYKEYIFNQVMKRKPRDIDRWKRVCN